MSTIPRTVGIAAIALLGAIAMQPASAMTQCGMASWYGLEAGTRRADGGSVEASGLSAAHRTLPFGTKVKVENLANGREATVEINDRGPFTNARLIDVSKGTAAELGFINKGVTRVRITTLEGGKETVDDLMKCP
jgi:rare lipoprotein A